MVRLMIAGLLLCGLSIAGCTNTVRGLGKDLGSDSVQHYNARGDVIDADVHVDNGVRYDSRTATEIP